MLSALEKDLTKLHPVGGVDGRYNPLNVYIHCIRDNVTFLHVLLASELIYSIKQRDYNLVNSSVLHSMLNVYYTQCSRLA